MATITRTHGEYKVVGDDGTTFYARAVRDYSGTWYVIEYSITGAPSQHKSQDLPTALAYIVARAVRD